MYRFNPSEVDVKVCNYIGGVLMQTLVYILEVHGFRLCLTLPPGSMFLNISLNKSHILPAYPPTYPRQLASHTNALSLQHCTLCKYLSILYSCMRVKEILYTSQRMLKKALFHFQLYNAPHIKPVR